MAEIKDLLTPEQIDANNPDSAAAIELASDYLNRDDFETVPAPLLLGVKKLAVSMLEGTFGSREIQSKKAGDVSVTYADVSSSTLPRGALSYLRRYRYTPGL